MTIASPQDGKGITVTLEAGAAAGSASPLFRAVALRAARDKRLRPSALQVLLCVFDLFWEKDARPDWSQPYTRQELWRASRLAMSRSAFGAAFQSLVEREYLEERKSCGYLSEFRASPRLLAQCAPALAAEFARIQANFPSATTAPDYDCDSAMSLVHSSSSSSPSARNLADTPALPAPLETSPSLASNRRSRKTSARNLEDAPPLTAEQEEVARVLASAHIGNPTRSALARMEHVTLAFASAHVRLAQETHKPIGILITRLREDDPAPEVCPVCGALDGCHSMIVGTGDENCGHVLCCPGSGSREDIEADFGPFQVLGKRC